MRENSIIKKIEKYDSEFDKESIYCYGIMYRFGVKTFVMMFTMGIILNAIGIKESHLYLFLGALIGFYIEDISNGFVAVKKQDKVELYILNLFQTKVKGTKTIEKNSIIEYKEKKGHYELKLDTGSKKVNVIISKKTLGFPKQKENSKEIMDMIILTENDKQ